MTQDLHVGRHQILQVPCSAHLDSPYQVWVRSAFQIVLIIFTCKLSCNSVSAAPLCPLSFTVLAVSELEAAAGGAGGYG
jgi:hypothetical protein